MRTIGFLIATSFAAAISPELALAWQAGQVVRLESRPSSIVMTRGESVQLSITALDAAGNPVQAPYRVAAPRQSLSYDQDGTLTGLEAGDYEIVVTAALSPEDNREPPSVSIPVRVNWPAIARIEIEPSPGTLYEGTTIALEATAWHADGSPRPAPAIEWNSSNPDVARVDRYGYASATGTGSVTITASFEGVRERIDYTIDRLPAVALEITGGEDEVRTGDVQTYSAVARRADGSVADDVPVSWTLAYRPTEGIIAPAAPGQVKDGKVVADVPGVYTVMASTGPLNATRRFTAVPRDVVQRLTVMGQGRQDTHYTSDIWVFEGVDGRDYALTGSRQGQSHAFVWDVTDPTNIRKTDSLQVDARSVNDVKASPDGRYAVLTREGASNRRNGIVIMDMATPAHPRVAAIYDEGLTGGVHNVYAQNDYLFALSDGDKYIILDMRDIYNPRYVSEYDHPNSRIHDVWVHDGIAYSAEWQTGVVMVDVGNGRWGGAIDNPVLIGTYPLPTGATHAVFPYAQESTGRFYLFVGDEITNRRGLPWEGSGPDVRMAYDPETGRGGYPRATSGYIQILDLTDPQEPEMVARYEVSEYGTHNIWVEDDVLYQAYYEGGVRLVDVSGELMGNLYTQGREIAVFKAHDPVGWIANAPAAWSVMPYKGNIFFSDISSGLWSIKLEPRERPVL